MQAYSRQQIKEYCMELNLDDHDDETNDESSGSGELGEYGKLTRKRKLFKEAKSKKAKLDGANHLAEEILVKCKCCNNCKEMEDKMRTSNEEKDRMIKQLTLKYEHSIYKGTSLHSYNLQYMYACCMHVALCSHLFSATQQEVLKIRQEASAP